MLCERGNTVHRVTPMILHDSQIPQVCISLGGQYDMLTDYPAVHELTCVQQSCIQI